MISNGDTGNFGQPLFFFIGGAYTSILWAWAGERWAIRVPDFTIEWSLDPSYKPQPCVLRVAIAGLAKVTYMLSKAGTLGTFNMPPAQPLFVIQSHPGASRVPFNTPATWHKHQGATVPSTSNRKRA